MLGLLLPRDPVARTAPFHAVLPALIVAVFIALPSSAKPTDLADDTLINLSGFTAPGAGQVSLS